MAMGNLSIRKSCNYHCNAQEKLTGVNSVSQQQREIGIYVLMIGVKKFAPTSRKLSITHNITVIPPTYLAHKTIGYEGICDST